MSKIKINVERQLINMANKCDSRTSQGGTHAPRSLNSDEGRSWPDPDNLDQMLSCSFKRPQERVNKARTVERWARGKTVGGKTKAKAIDLNVLQINLQGGFENKCLELAKLLNEKRVHIVLAQEVSTQENPEWKMIGYESFLCECRKQGRLCRTSAVLVRKDLRATVQALNTSGKTCAQKVELMCGNEVINIINWYQPPSDKIVTLKLDGGKGDTIYKKLIIAGDANANHPTFGYKQECPVGRWLVDLCAATNLTSLVSTDTPTTFLSSTGNESRPDQAIVSADILDRVERNVLEDIGSDHLPSLITVRKAIKVDRGAQKNRWNFKKAKWHEFTKELEKKLNEFSENRDTLSIEEREKRLIDAILQSAKRHIPRGHVRRFKPHWNAELDAAVKRRRTQREVYRKKPSLTNRSRYNALTRRAKRVSSGEKVNSWCTKCTSLNDAKDFGEAWKFLNRLQGKRSSGSVQPIRVNNVATVNRRREAEALNRHFSRVSRVEKSKDIDLKNREERRAHPCKASVGETSLEASFTMIELERALRQSKKGKSPGADGIMAEMLCKLSPKGKAHLLRLFNDTWTSGKLPNAWRKATIYSADS